VRARGPRLVAACLISLTGALFVGAGVAAAQTTTVPPIPVTGGATTTTVASTATTASSSSSSGSVASGSLASTGIAADLLVPLGFGLIGAGGVLQLAARRPRRNLGLL
jgi:hypothetical protein